MKICQNGHERVVQKAVNKGVLSGTGEGWNLKYDDLRVIVWLDRLGLLE